MTFVGDVSHIICKKEFKDLNDLNLQDLEYKCDPLR